MKARQHAKAAAGYAMNNAHQLAQAHALTAIALAMTEPQQPAAPEPTSFNVNALIYPTGGTMPADGDTFIHERTGEQWRWSVTSQSMVSLDGLE